MKRHKTIIADDATESIGLLVRLRFPWLVVGLLGGALASFFVSQFKLILQENIALAFFLPLIVYMSDAVGTQTQTIYIRNLSSKQINFLVYLLKEFAIGIILGVVFGFIIGVITRMWIGSPEVAWTVALSMFVTVATAPVVALIIPSILTEERLDPALGAGPFATIIQDVISLLLYLTIAAFILF